MHPIEPDLAITHTSTVTPDQIDHLGHMNVRYYSANAAEATQTMLGWLEIPSAEAPLVDLYTRHHHEQMEGADLEVYSTVLTDGPRLRFYHELRNAADGDLAATFVHTVDHPTPTTASTAFEIPAHGTPRSIDLSREPLTSAPSLDSVRELDIENRAARVVDAEDTGGGEVALPETAPMLIWGGTPPDGSEKEFVRRGPEGQPIGFATMETRLAIGSLPRLGTRIQSYGVVTAMGDKTTQMSMSAYELATEELLVSFEVVSLAFDIDARQSIAMPPDARAEDEARFHPELAPR